MKFTATAVFVLSVLGLGQPVVSDDLENPRIIKVLERLATQGRTRPLPLKRLYEVNNENEIVALELRGAKIKKGDLDIFAELEKVTRIDLSRSSMTDEQLSSLSGFAALKELNLNSTAITGRGLKHLRMMVQLENLDLGRTKVENASLETCKTLPNLKRLGLRGCNISSDGLAFLQTLKKLECIDLGDTGTADSGIELLKRVPTLSSIMLDQTKVTKDGMSKLATMPKLKWLATPEKTVKEWIRRVKAKDFAAANLISPVGLQIPATGVYSKEFVTAHKPQLKDKLKHQYRFRVQFLWEVDGRKPTTLFSELAVDRGAVKLIQMGVID